MLAFARESMSLTKDLVSHDFGYYLVGYQNLPTSHIWLAKSMATFLPNFGLTNLWHGKFWSQTNQAQYHLVHDQINCYLNFANSI